MKKLLFALIFSAIVLYGQEAESHLMWKIRTKTGTNIFVFSPAGNVRLKDSFLELLDTVKSLVVVRDRVRDVLDGQPQSIEQKRIVQIHKELDALCKKNGYACDADQPASLSRRSALLVINSDAVHAIELAADTRHVVVGHPAQEIAEMHRQILQICREDRFSCGDQH
ncbi:MAG: hypothetical protein WCF77_00295 [Minisyncoccia bacterium]